MSKHTNTPWLSYNATHGWQQFNIGDPSGENLIVSACDSTVDDDGKLANIALIVKAVNNHDELIRALKKIAKILNNRGLDTKTDYEIEDVVTPLLFKIDKGERK